MAGPRLSVAANSSPVAQVDCIYTPEKDNFSLQNCRAHVTRKADYKSLGNGQLVAKGWLSKIRAWIEGNNADARYHRAAYESTQRVSAAMFSEKYRSDVEQKQLDIADSDLVKARFYRQDNIRFNPQFGDSKSGLSKRDRYAVKISRWAHYANGVTELGAAPTGLLLKMGKIMFTPKADDRSLTGQARTCATLPLIAGAVTLFFVGVFGEGVGRAFKKVPEFMATELRLLAGSFSAVSAVSAIISLTFGAASCLTMSHSKLSPRMVSLIRFNQQKHLHRLFLLLNDAKDKPGAVTLIAKAMRKKIGADYLNDERSPILLSRLLEDVRSSENQLEVKRAMGKTIGSYLTEIKPAGDSPGSFLDPKSDMSELLSRENHFLALSNLIEHYAIHNDPHDNFMDMRHHLDRGAGKLRQGVLQGSASLMNVLGFASEEKQVSAFDRSTYKRYSTKNILDNAHQYGPLTRHLSKISAGILVVNNGILLSLNYQVTRPIASLAGHFTESVLKMPNSRTSSFSVGRAVASSIWAVLDAFLILPLAAGNGVGFNGPEASSSVKFPLQIPFGPVSLGVSVISTAAQMIVLAVPALLFMGAAKGACYLEGWEGNVARRFEPADSKRKPVTWG